MILYEYVCEHQDIIKDLIKLGMIPVDINHKVKVYRLYLEHRQTCKRMQAVENVSIDTGQCSSNIYKIVERMEQKVL